MVRMEAKKVKDLKPGDKLTVAGIEMEFSYMSGKHPAFVHNSNGCDIVYVNKNYTSETLLTDIL